MTARPPFDEHDALDAEERELAARLSALDAGGPSAALDARILAAARAAVAVAADAGSDQDAGTHPDASGAPARTPAPAAWSSRRGAGRRGRRWPTAVGAVATLVVAVGLAWQLKPLLDMPAPLRQAPVAASTEAEILAQAHPVPPAAPVPPSPEASDGSVADAASAPAPAAARPRAPAASRAVGRAARIEAPEAVAATAQVADDFVDEAVGHPTDVAAASAAAAAPQLRQAQQSRDAGARVAEQAEAGDAGAPEEARPVAEDAALPAPEWLARIRERRDAGDVDGARESLRRFLRAYPRHRLPDDLRALRTAPR